MSSIQDIREAIGVIRREKQKHANTNERIANVLDDMTTAIEESEAVATASIAVGEVVTGEPGSAATVVNMGTPEHAVFVFTIPRGNTGAGEKGEAGLSVYHGTGEPAADIGNIDDMYINTSSWDVFGKTADAMWVLTGNIKGAPGDDGVGIEDMNIDENGDLIVMLTSGEEVNAGHVGSGGGGSVDTVNDVAPEEGTKNIKLPARHIPIETEGVDATSSQLGAPIRLTQEQCNELLATDRIEVEGNYFYNRYRFYFARESVIFEYKLSHYGNTPPVGWTPFGELQSMIQEQAIWVGEVSVPGITMRVVFLIMDNPDGTPFWCGLAEFTDDGTPYWEMFIAVPSGDGVLSTKHPIYDDYLGMGATLTGLYDAYSDVQTEWNKLTELPERVSRIETIRSQYTVVNGESSIEFHMNTIDILNATAEGAYHELSIYPYLRDTPASVKIVTIKNKRTVDLSIKLEEAGGVPPDATVAFIHPQGNTFTLPVNAYCEVSYLIQEAVENEYETTVIYNIYE